MNENGLDEWNHCHSNKRDKEIRRLYTQFFTPQYFPIPYEFFELSGNRFINKCEDEIHKLFFRLRLSCVYS